MLDRLNTEIKTYLLSMPAPVLTAAEANRQGEILTFATNLEHAGDVISRDLLSIAARRLKRRVAFSAAGERELVELIDRVIANARLAASLFVSRDPSVARMLAAEKEAFRNFEREGIAAHFRRLRSGDANTLETSSLHLDALRDLKRLNSHLIAGTAYPMLQACGDLLPTRLRRVGATS